MPTDPRESLLETDPTPVCACLVGWSDLRVLGVGDWLGQPIVVQSVQVGTGRGVALVEVPRAEPTTVAVEDVALWASTRAAELGVLGRRRRVSLAA